MALTQPLWMSSGSWTAILPSAMWLRTRAIPWDRCASRHSRKQSEVKAHSRPGLVPCLKIHQLAVSGDRRMHLAQSTSPLGSWAHLAESEVS